jgi:dCTP deaminase
VSEALEHALFAAPDPASAAAFEHSTGILPSQAIREAIASGEVLATETIAEGQIQPASLDLRLGAVAYRVRASFLPGPRASVGQKIEALSMHRIDLTAGAVLERDCVYIAPLMESLRLRKRTSAVANPKSSTGRLDVFARVITDRGSEFDQVREGYRGPLWAEISPRSFSVLVRTGLPLVQLRIKRGSPPRSSASLRKLNDEVRLVHAAPGDVDIRHGLIAVTVDTCGVQGAAGVIGYRAKKHAGLIDMTKSDYYEPADFWDPVVSQPGHGVVLDPDDFYILASKEAVTVPADHAAEMLAYDTVVGEFRVHYAGFFDPGFGHAEAGGAGARAVLEVRSHDVPFMVEDGQVVGRLLYERLTARPDKLYGATIGSSYQRQGLMLAKQFLRPA